MVRRSRRQLAVLILVFGMSSFAGAEVYRCTESGKTVYSDRPCSGGTAATVAMPPPSTASPGSVNPQYEANMGRIAIGQTALQVEIAWGRPKTKNIETRGAGPTEQWTYERQDGAYAISFRNGLVSDFARQPTEVRPRQRDEPAPRELNKADLEAQIRAERAGERKFLGSGIHQADVLNRIGEPDSKALSGIVECWIYNPTKLDWQTSTKICFGLEGTAISVDRRVAR